MGEREVKLFLFKPLLLYIVSLFYATKHNTYEIQRLSLFCKQILDQMEIF